MAEWWSVDQVQMFISLMAEKWIQRELVSLASLILHFSYSPKSEWADELISNHSKY